MTIELMLIGGLIVGSVIGLTAPNQGLGCIALLLVPICMVLYIDWWQGENPDMLRSTSALDFIFGPLWPTIGAISGFIGSRLFRTWIRTR